MLILPGAALVDTYKRAERLCVDVQQLQIRQQQDDLDITISLGVAEFPEHGTTHVALVHAVETAMQQAIQAGGNQVVYASAE